MVIDEVKAQYGERAYIKTVGGQPCSMCSDTVHGTYERVAVEGCATCDREMSVHSPEHFRCKHGAHCTRDYCW